LSEAILIISPRPSRAKPQVLVVDDEPAIRETVATLLEEEGYQVRRAKDGVEALSTLAGDKIDLILADINMPRLDGATMVRKLRSRGNRTPIVLMSAIYADIDLPGVRFVPKPFVVDRLLSAVTSALATNGRATPSLRGK
jgi:two-component system, OmpR family, response regulator MprA